MSIVVPVYNGGALVGDLHGALAPVLDTLEGGAEIVFVDDGSRDDTLDKLRALQAGDSRIRIVELAGNFGQHAAFAAGFEHARGDRLVTMDADLQCDPNDVPRLLEPLGRGFDLVSGVRLKRQDPPVRRIFSQLLTWLVGRMAGVELRDIGCPYNALTRDVGRSLAAFGELRRFLKPIAVTVARRVTEVEVSHRSRHRERPRSSYSATGLIRLFMDFFVNALGDVFAWVFVASTALTAAALVVVVLAGLTALVQPGARALALAGLVAVILGGLIAILGLAGDYVQRIYRQSSGRPFYLVRRLHDGTPAPANADAPDGHRLVNVVVSGRPGDGS